MKKKISLLLMVVTAFFTVSCGDKNDDQTPVLIPNLIAGEWFLDAPKLISEDAEVKPGTPVKDLYTYAPFLLDWMTTETFAAMGDEGTQWSGTEISVLASTIAGPMIMEEFTAAQFKADGSISATVVSKDETGKITTSIVEQDYVTYKVISASELRILLNFDAILTKASIGDLARVLASIHPYFKTGFPVNYKITNDIITFSVNKDFILPIVKTIVPIVAEMEVPTILPDYSNMMEVMMIQTVKSALSERVVNSTTMFDVMMSFKNTEPVIAE